MLFQCLYTGGKGCKLFREGSREASNSLTTMHVLYFYHTSYPAGVEDEEKLA